MHTVRHLVGDPNASLEPDTENNTGLARIQTKNILWYDFYNVLVQ